MGPRVHHPRTPPHRTPDPTVGEEHSQNPHTDPAPTAPTTPFTPIGFHLDVPNPFAGALGTQAPTQALFRAPLQQGATGMVPIEAPTTPTTTATHLQNRSDVDQLEDRIKDEIQRLQARRDREIARHPDRTPTEDRNLSALLRLRDELGRLKTAGQIRSTNFRNLVARARQLLLTGATQRNRDTVHEGQRIAAATWNYYQANTQRAHVLRVIEDHYPASSRGIQTGYFHVRAEEMNPNDPSTDTLNNLAIIRTYERLSRSNNPADHNMAMAFSGVVADIHDPNHYRALNDQITVEELENHTQYFHNLYGNPADTEHPHAIVQFLGHVEETSRRDMEQNEGYQGRRRLQEGLASLENLRHYAQILETPGDALTPELVGQTREALLHRLEITDRTIVQERDRQRANRPHDRTVRYREGNQWVEEDLPSLNPTPEEARLESLHQEVTRLQTELSSLSNNDPQAAQHLSTALHTTLRAEEEHVRILMHGELRQANNQELTAEIERVQTGTGNFADLGVRLEHYQQVMTQMDTAIMRESVRSRIEMYRSMLPLVQTTDHTMTVLSAGQGGDSDFSSRYEELIHRYERIGASMDAGHMDQARRDFIQLEQAQVGQELQDHFVFSGRLQTGIALGIVAASAATMNMAGLALLPETALAIEAGEATLAARVAYAAATAPVFQLTHYAMSDAFTGTHQLYNPTQTARENAGRYVEDYIRNFGNNVFIGETMRFVQQSAYARLAERQLVQEGTLTADGIRTAAESVLIRARMARVAQNGITSTAVSAAALGPELGAVQAWGFLDRNLTDAVHVRFDLNRGTNETILNSQSWEDQAIFILGMRVGHLTTAPLLGPLNGAARDIAIGRVRGRYDTALQASRTAGEAWNRYVTTGEGRGVDVRARLQEAVSARQRLENHPAVRDLVPPEQRAETQRLADALARANDMRLGNPYRNPLFGLTFGILGADGGAAFIPSRRRGTLSRPVTNPNLTKIQRALSRINPSHLRLHPTTTNPNELRISVDPQGTTKLHRTLLGIARDNGLAIVSDPGESPVRLRPANNRNDPTHEITIHVVTPLPFPPERPLPPSRTGRHSPQGREETTPPRPDTRLPRMSSVAIGAPPYNPPPTTEARPQTIDLVQSPLALGETRPLPVLEGAPAHVALRRTDEGQLRINNQTGVPITVWHTSGETEEIPASQRRLEYPLQAGDHVIVGEGDTARHWIVRDNPNAFIRRPVETQPTQTPPLSRPIARNIYNFCHSPLGPTESRTPGMGYSFQSEARDLTILHRVGQRNGAKDVLRHQAAAQNIPITEVNETHWRLGGADGVDVHFQALNPEHTRPRAVTHGVRFPTVTVRNRERIAHLIGEELTELGYTAPSLEQLESPESRNTIAGRVFDAIMRHASNHPIKQSVDAIPIRLQSEIDHNSNGIPVVPESPTTNTTSSHPILSTDPTIPTTTSTPAQPTTTPAPPPRLTTSPHVPQIHPAGSPIINFAARPLGNGERIDGSSSSYEVRSGISTLRIPHDQWVTARQRILNEANRQGLTVTQPFEDQWIIHGDSGEQVVLNLERLTPPAAEVPRTSRRGRHPLTTNPLFAAVWGLAGGMGPSGPLGSGGRRGAALISITGNRQSSVPASISDGTSSHQFSIIYHNGQWRTKGLNLPRNHRVFVMRPGHGEVTASILSQTGLLNGDRISIVRERFLGNEVVGTIEFRTPPEAIPPVIPTPSPQPTRLPNAAPAVPTPPIAPLTDTGGRTRAANDDHTVDEPTNPNMQLPAFIGMNSNIDLVTIGGMNRGNRGVANIDFPGVTPQSSPPVLFRREGDRWVINTVTGSFVSINGRTAHNGDAIHLGDHLLITVMTNGQMESRQATVTDQGLDIEGVTQTATHIAQPLQTAARGPSIVPPPSQQGRMAITPYSSPRFPNVNPIVTGQAIDLLGGELERSGYRRPIGEELDYENGQNTIAGQIFTEMMNLLNRGSSITDISNLMGIQHGHEGGGFIVAMLDTNKNQGANAIPVVPSPIQTP